MTEWITTVIESLGYVGIGLLMFLENIFPPIPSELIMPLAGFTASQGKMALVPAIAAGVIGTVLGALPWYYLGKFLGEDRIKQWITKHGTWLGISPNEIDKTKQWFYRHGSKAVLLGRMVPGVRTLISLPAGFSHMPIAQFLIYSSLGTLAWTLLLTLAGYLLGKNYTLVEEYLGPISKIVLGGFVIAGIVWIIRRRRTVRRQQGKR
ncbi:DedA family protein [Thermocoleostomius sinensis]|jgi:membrane protein DedA with SNARE-associated domain|uniref:DedA family protein n=1 Tax=Thermocoleostomius sinensis A174 TaxID=2016057 RepID=A0A9E8ZC57_9CYAN|nr:DedA family protein [Thermocoleostomius sinensis]WAL59142.1 DedA family protein [Thermocoleostomius sinensis A174]